MLVTLRIYYYTILATTTFLVCKLNFGMEMFLSEARTVQYPWEGNEPPRILVQRLMPTKWQVMYQTRNYTSAHINNFFYCSLAGEGAGYNHIRSSSETRKEYAMEESQSVHFSLKERYIVRIRRQIVCIIQFILCACIIVYNNILII